MARIAASPKCARSGKAFRHNQGPSETSAARLRCNAAGSVQPCRLIMLGRLLDHFVGYGKKGRWNFEFERLSGLEVDDELEFDGLDHRKIGGLGTLEDAADVNATLAKGVRDTGAIAHQAASRRVFADRVNRGHHMPGGQRYDLTTPRLNKRIAGDGKCTGPLFDERGEGSLKVVLGAGFYDKQLSPERLCRNLCVFCFDLGVGIGRVHQYSDC